MEGKITIIIETIKKKGSHDLEGRGGNADWAPWQLRQEEPNCNTYTWESAANGALNVPR